MSQLKKSIWIIEDVEDLHQIYATIFEDDSYDLKFFKAFNDFKEVHTSTKNHPDIIIADLMLSDGHFFQLLNDSDLTLNTPFLVISSSDAKESFEQAFEAGAIDYLLKPFNMNEVRAKVDRHIQTIEDKIQEASKSLEALNLDLSQYTNKELRIIESFNVKDDKTLHRNDIVKLIWKNIVIHPNTLDVHIYNLRKKLKTNNYTIKAVGNGLFRFLEINPAPQTESVEVTTQA